MRQKGNYILVSLILFVFGFLIAFSYQQTNSKPKVTQLSENEWEKDYFYRQQLIDIEDKNKKLEDELTTLRQKVQDFEQDIGEERKQIGDLVDTKQRLQILTGELPVEGEGIEITLRDADYIPSEDNVNQYIVHDRHIHLVINELYSAGAKAIAINGQRIYADSFIQCVGPVVSVDGNVYPAPFVVSAIGAPEVLDVSLNLTNGVVDNLLYDNIEVTVEQMPEIEMDARAS